MRQLRALLQDLFLIATATVLALLLRDNLELSATRLALIMPYLLVTLGSAMLVLPMMGATRTLWRYSSVSDYSRLALCCALIVLLAVSAGFAIFRLDNVSRALPIIQLILMTILLVGLRMAERAHRFRHHRAAAAIVPERSCETVIVVGLNTVAELFLQAVAEHGEGQMAVAGVIGRQERQTGQLFRSHKVLGVPEDIESIVRELEVHGVYVDRLVIAVGADQFSDAARAAIRALELRRRIKLDYFAERLKLAGRLTAVPLVAGQAAATSTMPSCGSQSMSEALANPYWRKKRAFDFTLATIAVAALSPAFVLVALLSFCAVGRPIVFWQQRPGLRGRTFKVYKFRTLLAAHDWRGQRLSDAQRETSIGAFLRASRLDELPQLLNILAGHMSFVGPRPLLNADQLEAFKDRLSVRPGLTGWAQVNGGRHVSPSDKMALDLWYIHNASLGLDCRILLLTARMLVLGEQTNPPAVEQAWLELGGRS